MGGAAQKEVRVLFGTKLIQKIDISDRCLLSGVTCFDYSNDLRVLRKKVMLTKRHAFETDV